MINVRVPSDTIVPSPSIHSSGNFSTHGQIDVHNIPLAQSISIIYPIFGRIFIDLPKIVEKTMKMEMDVNGVPMSFIVRFNFHTMGRALNLEPKKMEFDGRKLWEKSGQWNPEASAMAVTSNAHSVIARQSQNQ